MRTSQFLLATVKDTPSDAVVVSHQLMLRAGMIRKLAAGLYNWLPLGLRVLRKVETIVREEMDASGALELLMPTVQPAELWQESKRWEKFGPELLRIQDRHQRDFCLGPTHEEVITDIFRREYRSYRQLPVNLYQIQTKFRDEVRPRFGVMSAREFIMKDAYSFHIDKASLEQTYQVMYDCYSRIFTRLGLEFRAVLADTGSIGGSASHEFHVLADSGEDAIAFCDQSDYAANVEMAPTPKNDATKPAAPKAEMVKVATPDVHSIEQVCDFLKVDATQTVKTLIVCGNPESGHELVALLLRGDHELNTIKAEKHPWIQAPLAFASGEQIKKSVACEAGSLGPVALDIAMLADYAVAEMSDFVCGANQDGYHLSGVNWERDVKLPDCVDLRNVQNGDPSPDGKGTLSIRRGIEVGHIFQLGDIYSGNLNATVLDESGKAVVPLMGCYGIGITRVVAAAIEQNHDDRGIIWNQAMCPFFCALVPINQHKSQRLRDAADNLYTELKRAGIDVLLDDRKERPGVMFADMELIGIPHRIVLSDRGLDSGMVEDKGRRDSDAREIAIDSIVTFLKEKQTNTD